MKKILTIFLAMVTVLCLLTASSSREDVDAATANAGCKRAIERAIEYRLGIITKDEFYKMHYDAYWQKVDLESAWAEYLTMATAYQQEALEYYGENITYTVSVSNERRLDDQQWETTRTKLDEGADTDKLKDAYMVDFEIAITGSKQTESSSGQDATFIYYDGQWYTHTNK